MHKIKIESLYKDIQASVSELRQDPNRVKRSRKVVEGALKKNEAFYGINTGFGILANKRVGADQLNMHFLILIHTYFLEHFK